MKIAICYFGMTRSTRFVYRSHHERLFNIFKQNNIEYDIFMHTWKTKNDENIISDPSSREHLCNIKVDYEEYKLLNPTFYKIESQDDFLNIIEFENYFNEELYKIHGGDSHHEWKPQLILNHLCALESQKRVYTMVTETSKFYDYIMFIRPDVEILNDFNIHWLDSSFDIMIPNTDHNEGLNDRFAILPFHTSSKYAERIDEIIEFRKNHGRIVSEKYVKFIINKYYNNLSLIDFIMRIKRPTNIYAY
jgi:hypothetical protein